MRQISRLVAACLAATVVIALAAVPAAARARNEVSTTAILASGIMTFAPGEGLPEIICDVTFHATALRLINKVLGALVGSVTSILTANARSSSGSAPSCSALLPMRASYNSIFGTLPNISGFTLRVAGAFLIGVTAGFRFGCLYANELVVRGPENPIRRWEVRESAPLSRTLEGFCPREGLLTGTLTVTPTLTVRLLER